MTASGVIHEGESIKLWEAGSGHTLAVLPVGGAVTRLLFSTHGDCLAAEVGQERVRVFDMSDVRGSCAAVGSGFRHQTFLGCR